MFSYVVEKSQWQLAQPCMAIATYQLETGRRGQFEFGPTVPYQGGYAYPHRREYSIEDAAAVCNWLNQRAQGYPPTAELLRHALASAGARP